ncbi:CPBP family intramembrane glutamic endopeptidase [Pseudoduganella violaceinigra]|uniref:CPBP family intramembrane glutamic endopeptidase n=1 Tax=Pseudoduganella violaceinigra TaxID=246602 RepID=UPI000400C43B|nr:CPBP family intramembrane glutamic endopeptidase [Pseudoduganella violaceinigra]
MQQAIHAPLSLPFRARLARNPVVRILAGIACIAIPFLATMMLVQNLVPKEFRLVWHHLLAAILCLAGYRFYVRRFEQRAAGEAALGGVLSPLLQGLGIGAAISVVVVGLLAAAGALSIAAGAHWSAALKPLSEQAMVAVMEELLFRALLFRIVEARWGTRASLLVNVLLFALAHLPNQHVTALAVLNTGVAGLALCAAWMLTRSLWLPVGVHFAWNYLFDGVLGVPVSGHAARGWLHVQLSGPEWLSGGAYGVEGSLATLVVWGIAAALMLRLRPKRP